MKYPQLVSMPSAVSEWLEEQLEARGIDAVVYTRYVLSLLYKDPEDIICPDQDSHFNNTNKGLKSSGGGKKKFYRSINYWGQSDIDRLKRSAAVECLKSASDQKCGIEVLVDELCEKLKEIKNDPDLNEEITAESNSELNKSFQDPVKRYYAAFPPLSKNTASTNIITLIPKWFGSPKKKLVRNKSRSSSCEDKLHFKVETDNMKARFSGKQRCNFFSRKNSLSKSDISILSDMDCSNNRLITERKKSLEKIGCSSSSLSINDETDFFDEKDESMYDDLPVDIIDLLDSPTPQEVNIDMMNMANMRDTGNKKFIQCGTNITSSIWSNDTPINDNIYNAKLTGDSNLDLQFQSINIDENFWSSDINTLKENVANSFYENFSKSLTNESRLSPWGKLDKWSEVDTYENEVQMMNVVRKSLIKLNHSNKSCFTEVKPNLSKISNVSNFEISNKKPKYETDKEIDLLSSDVSHFRPINEKLVKNLNGKYADGTTFAIPSSLLKVKFQRSESGAMYIDAESRSSKKYFEHNRVNDELVLKYIINPNDKASQTDVYDDADDFSKNMEEENEFYFPGDHDLLDYEENLMDCKIDKTAMIMDDDYNDTIESDCVVAEIFGKMELKCDKCKKSSHSNYRNSWELRGKQEKHNIWSGGEICMTCLQDASRTTPNHDQTQLREDITQDGEQLLSDLSSLQKCYMDELPIAELSCNIDTLIGAKEWNEAFFQDTVPLHSGSFSFATRLQQDCLVNMAAIPTLRSITL